MEVVRAVVGGSPAELERLRAAKSALRSALLAARARMPPAALVAAAAELAEVALAVPEIAAADPVAAYVSVGAEPGTRPLLDALRGQGRTVLLPVVAPGRTLAWAAYAGADRLVPGRYGLLEPAGPRLPPDAVGAVGALLVPALAVDVRGQRLGRGGGYYDRLLAGPALAARAYAVVYPGEVVPAVPVEPHDVRVAGALTPAGPVPVRRP